MKLHDSHSAGFTLIELLVVIGIIGILASMAILEYGSYRQRSFDARALSDIRNTMSAQEAYFTDTETYASDQADLTGFDTESPAVTLIISADEGGWSGSTYHPQGTTTYCVDSSNNSGIVEVDGTDASCP